MTNHIKELREKAGIEQQALAAKIGISPATLGNYEAGRRGAPVETLCAIADILDCSLDMLVRGKEKDRPEERSAKGILQKYDGLSDEQLAMMIATLQALLADRRFQAHLRQGD